MAKAPAATKRMSPTGAKEYTDGRFQLRLPTAEGTVVVVTLEAHKTLVDLANAVAAHPDFLNHDSRPSSCLRFSTTYPRKLFSQDEMRKSIKVRCHPIHSLPFFVPL